MTITTGTEQIDLLDDDGIFARSIWSGKIFNGQWAEPRGGEVQVTETATGALLGIVGLANAEDVASATRRAAQAQPAWADTPVEQRAACRRTA